MENVKFRHEMKYVISFAQAAIIQERLEKVMSHDVHAVNGAYNIRSVYFDTFDNRCYYENENGVDKREKYRIRIYNHSTNRISLECKQKENGMTQKEAVLLDYAQTKDILNDRDVFWKLNPSMPKLLCKFGREVVLNGMHPVVIVDYDRIPYVYDAGNVRVTLDMNIASSTYLSGFFEEKIRKRPIMPAGSHLLEVKWDSFLPDVIYRTLSLNCLERVSYSKYYLCRKFSN